jgi:hypothetical protein
MLREDFSSKSDDNYGYIIGTVVAIKISEKRTTLSAELNDCKKSGYERR